MSSMENVACNCKFRNQNQTEAHGYVRFCRSKPAWYLYIYGICRLIYFCIHTFKYLSQVQIESQFWIHAPASELVIYSIKSAITERVRVNWFDTNINLFSHTIKYMSTTVYSVSSGGDVPTGLSSGHRYVIIVLSMIGQFATYYLVTFPLFLHFFV